MWINEAFAHYFAFLADWKFIGANEGNVNALCRESRNWNCSCFRTVNENGWFFYTMKFQEKMHSVNYQGPLYQKGRAWIDHLPYIYEWGAMFVRMLEATIGRALFQRAMQRYIKTYQYGNVDHEKLWSALEYVNPFKDENVTISNIFNSWIHQRGVPFLHVSRSKAKGTENILNLRQVHYSGPKGNRSALSPSVWYIPINFILIREENGTYERIPNDNYVHQYLMKNTSETVQMSIHEYTESDNHLVAILNVNFSGTYHVGYDENEWKRIGSVLMANSSLIPWFDRLQFVESIKTSIRREEIQPHLLLCIGEYIQVSSSSIVF